MKYHPHVGRPPAVIEIDVEQLVLENHALKSQLWGARCNLELIAEGIDNPQELAKLAVRVLDKAAEELNK